MIFENTYIYLSEEAYSSVERKKITEIVDEVETEKILTYADIFPNAKVLDGFRLVGDLFNGSELPDYVNQLESAGYTVGWGLDSQTDVKILGLVDAKTLINQSNTPEVTEEI